MLLQNQEFREEISCQTGCEALLWQMQLQVAEKQTEVGGNCSVRAVSSHCKEDDFMSFGENLQLIRKKNQLSQESLAEMLGVSRQAVSKWEIGELPQSSFFFCGFI